MGLLDDAIREHLDLKRRRGADPTEVERLEREALGPVRRNLGPSAADEPESDLIVGSAYDEPDEPIAADAADTGSYDGPSTDPGFAYDREEWNYDDDRTRIVAPGGDEPDPSPRAADPGPSVPPPLAFTARDDDEPFADEPRPGAVGDETSEYDVEEALATEDDDEDVLEETPEFLQDTPDHDRLWFEQRPPRDFDFDG